MAADVNAREEGITAFNGGRYSVALSKLKEAAGGGDPTAATFLALTQAATGDCAHGVACAH